jgi:hypothetical protein
MTGILLIISRHDPVLPFTLHTSFPASFLFFNISQKGIDIHLGILYTENGILQNIISVFSIKGVLYEIRIQCPTGPRQLSHPRRADLSLAGRNFAGASPQALFH